MRVGMILDKEFPPDIRVENEAISLIKNGHTVFLLSYAFNGLQTYEEYKGIKIYRIRANKNIIKKLKGLNNTLLNFYPYYFSKKIIKFINKFSIEILHTHDLHLLGSTFLANKEFNLQIVADLHENYVDALKHYEYSSTFPGKLLISISKWREKEIEWCNKADYLITVIDEAVDRYKNLGVDPNRIEVVANYVNRNDFFKPDIEKSIIEKFKGKFKVTYVGGFDLHRGLESVVKSIPYVIEMIPNLRIVLVGKGKNFDSLQKIAKDLKIKKYISFEGWQPPEYLPSYIDASDICLIPHLKTVHTDNTIPHKLFHYMLLEKPVIATNCNPIERIINETKSGLIYKSGDVKDFADKVIKLYKNEKLRKEMGENGKKAVVEKYNWEKTSENLVKLYNSIE